MKVASKMHATYHMLIGSEMFSGSTSPLAVDSTSHINKNCKEADGINVLGETCRRW